VNGVYFHKIPLFRKTAVWLQAIETAGSAARHRARIFKNSLLIPLLPQIAKRFQGDAARGAEASQRPSLRSRGRAAGIFATAPAGLGNMAMLYRAQGHYAEAEPLLKRAMAISEKALGPDHPGVAISLNNLAGLYRAQGRYGEAAPLYERALAISEKALGPQHPTTKAIRENLRSMQDNLVRSK
jgi:tetratricopeptide (TPR) repeat protein